MSNTVLNAFSTQPFPDFGIPPGYLTSNGTTLETMLGGYYRLWLTNEGLLTGDDAADAKQVYFRANVIERTIASAQAFAAGLLPAASVNVDYYGPTQSDPLFDAIGAGVALLNQQMAIDAVEGRLGGDAQSLTSAYGAELALTRSILFGYPLDQASVPATPQGTVDITTIPIAVTAGTSGAPVNLGGLGYLDDGTDPFLFEYADGLPPSQVGWGQLTPAGINQILRLTIKGFDLEFRTPYLARVQSSNVASHVVRTLVQAATGNGMTGALGEPSTKVVVLIASDVNITGLAGLFDLDWILPGYQPDYCSPGGALVFQLRQSQSTGEYIVRASYIAQTLDQLRDRTALTLDAPPASAPVFIPGCSGQNATFDCPLGDFVRLANHKIDAQSADQMDTNESSDPMTRWPGRIPMPMEPAPSRR